MSTVGEVAKYVRSKNAGPFWLTIDIFCDAKSSYDAIANSNKLTAGRIADMYKVDPGHVKIFPLPDLNIIKISFPRSVIQGDRNERDMHGGQQYISMLDFEL